MRRAVKRKAQLGLACRRPCARPRERAPERRRRVARPSSTERSSRSRSPEPHGRARRLLRSRTRTSSFENYFSTTATAIIGIGNYSDEGFRQMEARGAVRARRLASTGLDIDGAQDGVRHRRRGWSSREQRRRARSTASIPEGKTPTTAIVSATSLAARITRARRRPIGADRSVASRPTSSTVDGESARGM